MQFRRCIELPHFIRIRLEQPCLLNSESHRNSKSHSRKCRHARQRGATTATAFKFKLALNKAYSWRTTCEDAEVQRTASLWRLSNSNWHPRMSFFLGLSEVLKYDTCGCRGTLNSLVADAFKFKFALGNAKQSVYGSGFSVERIDCLTRPCYDRPYTVQTFISPAAAISSQSAVPLLFLGSHHDDVEFVNHNGSLFILGQFILPKR